MVKFLTILGFIVAVTAHAADLPLPAETRHSNHDYSIASLVKKNWIPKAFTSLDASAIYNQSYEQDGFSLPTPDESKKIPKVLHLRDAILLALRFNPTIKSEELQRVVDKYALIVARNKFQPQYTFDLEGTVTKGSHPSYTLTPSVSVTNEIGTKISLSQNNNINGAWGTTTLTVDQPILRGFGAVNMYDYENALDSEEAAKLSFKQGVISQVVAVVQAYRTLVGDYNSLDIQKRTLDEEEITNKQTALKVKAGKMSRSDLLQEQATLETTRLSYVQQVDSVNQSYQAFLAAVGLTPAANIKISRDLDFKKYKIPSLKESIKLALKENIDYQSALIKLRLTERALESAKDSTRWKLDLSASVAAGRTKPNGETSNVDVAPSVSAKLSIPIDDVGLESSLVDARIALEDAKLQLRVKKQGLIRDIYNKWISLKNQRNQIDISLKQVSLQRRALSDAQLKKKYGKATVFEVNQLQDQLLQQETSSVSTQIAYLNGISAFYQSLGITLEKWDIKLRY